MKGKKPEEREFSTTNKRNSFDKLSGFPGKLFLNEIGTETQLYPDLLILLVLFLFFAFFVKTNNWWHAYINSTSDCIRKKCLHIRQFGLRFACVMLSTFIYKHQSNIKYEKYERELQIAKNLTSFSQRTPDFCSFYSMTSHHLRQFVWGLEPQRTLLPQTCKTNSDLQSLWS